jgi:hypothetical protein
MKLRSSFLFLIAVVFLGGAAWGGHLIYRSVIDDRKLAQATQDTRDIYKAYMAYLLEPARIETPKDNPITLQSLEASGYISTELAARIKQDRVILHSLPEDAPAKAILIELFSERGYVVFYKGGDFDAHKR